MPNQRRRAPAETTGYADPSRAQHVVLPMPETVTDKPVKPGSERVGDILKRRRQQRGDDISQIAEYLCIRRIFLEALEQNDYEALPAEAYVVGFLRTYAEFLGFDGKEAVEAYRKEMAGRRAAPVLSMPTPISEGRAPSSIIITAAIVAMLLIYGLWYGFSSSNRVAVSKPPALPTPIASAPSLPTTDAKLIPQQNTIEPPPAPQPLLTSSPLSTGITLNVPASATEQSAQPSEPADVNAQSALTSGDTTSNHLVIRAEQPSWVSIADAKGKVIFDKVMKAGDTYKVPDGKGLRLTTGNSTGIVFILDGTALPKLHRNGAKTMRDIMLDAPKLRAQTQGGDQ